MHGKCAWNMITALAGAVALSLSFGGSVQAASIGYSATNIAANQWRFDYSAANDSLGVDLEWFAVYFESEFYANLAVDASPPGWDSLVAEPEPTNGLDGFFDSLGLVGIAPGATLDGFAVRFDWLGAGAPGTQTFEVLDPDTLAVLESGRTLATGAAVPEPGSLFLAIAGLFGLALARHQRPRRVTSVTLLRHTSG